MVLANTELTEPTSRRGIKRRGKPNEIDAYVGDRIKERRLALNMSQSKLADLATVTFQQIQKYENGSNRVGAARLHALAERSAFRSNISSTAPRCRRR